MRLINFILLAAVCIAGSALSSAVFRPDVRPDASGRDATRQVSADWSTQRLQRERQALAELCSREAGALTQRLPVDFEVVVATPFILAGNLSQDELKRLEQRILQPATAALSRAYFDLHPDQPIQVVVARGEETYRDCAQRLDQHRVSSYAAYYNRDARRIVVNIEGGTGSLLHELTHALSQFDFPGMPEWFDEGLAAAYEDAQFSPDDLLLIPEANWRRAILLDALRRPESLTIQGLCTSTSIRGEGEGDAYALSQGLCLYLEQRQLLGAFYRKLRSRIDTDPTGWQTLCEILGTDKPDEIDRLFATWALPAKRAGAAPKSAAPVKVVPVRKSSRRAK